MSIGWKFPSASGGQKVGLNNGDIETFKDKPIKYLAREAVQNSLDAGINDGVVRVEFKSFKLKPTDFPDREGLLNALNKGKEKWDYIPDAKEFYENAISSINKEVEFLRISDFNTSGLNGSVDNTGNWDDLVNSTGVSAKEGNKSGSHGIGKNAPFACSNLRTVFYSTLDTDGNKASKGVSKLASYCLGENDDGSENMSQPTGFYGDYSDYKINNIFSMLSLDPTFDRKDPGTDVYIAGFRTDFFKDKLTLNAAIIAEIVDSFLVAIWNEKLIVEVDGVIISKHKLPEIMKNYQKQLDKTTIMVYEMLDNNVTWVNIPFTQVKGSIDFALKFDKNANNKISFYRNTGMKIFDDPNRCSTLRYVGLAIIQGDELNSYLRKLENASHNKWEPNRYKPEISKELLRSLFRLITDALNKQAEEFGGEESDIEKAGDFMPDDINNNENLNQNKKANKNLNILISAEKKVYSKITSAKSLTTTIIDDGLLTKTESKVDVDGQQKGEAFLNTGHKKKKGGHREPENANTNNGDSNNGNKDVNVKSKEIRIFCIDKSKQIYRFIFTPNITNDNCAIEFFKIAEMTEKDPLTIENIISCPQPTVTFKLNRINNIQFTEDVPITIDLQFRNENYSTMEVKMYAHKK